MLLDNNMHKPKIGRPVMIHIPEEKLKRLLDDRQLYGLQFAQMGRALRRQGINVSDNGLKLFLRREGFVRE